MAGKLIIFSAPSGSGKSTIHQFPAEAESEPAFFHLGYQPGPTWYGKGRSGILFPYTG